MFCFILILLSHHHLMSLSHPDPVWDLMSHFQGYPCVYCHLLNSNDDRDDMHTPDASSVVS